MSQPARRRLNYANVMSTIAVFVALGGGSYAAIKLPRDSVGSPQIKSGAVKRADLGKGAVDSARVRDGSLQAADFAKAALERLRGAAGPAGAPGAAGPAGAPGAAGKDAPTADLSLEHTTVVGPVNVFTHSFEVTNSGPSATWAVLTFRQPDREWVTELPSQPEIVCTAREDSAGDILAAYVYCVLGTIEAGATKSFVLENGGCAGATRTARATLATTLADPTPGDLATSTTYTNTDCAG